MRKKIGAQCLYFEVGSNEPFKKCLEYSVVSRLSYRRYLRRNIVTRYCTYAGCDSKVEKKSVGKRGPFLAAVLFHRVQESLARLLSPV
jgi:hypothetical protein